jgi:uncharacterized protein (UPF0276 family)
VNIARDALGIGLRRPHVDALLSEHAPIGFLEVIAENHLDAGSLPRARLDEIAARYPVVGHGVALNLVGAEPLDLVHLERVRELVRAYGMPWFSDHLCWSASGGHRHHDLLPAPYDPELVPYVAARARFVQDFLGVPFGIENLSSYVAWGRDQMPEWEFYRQVVDASDCWYMLDLNNIYVSSVNHGFDPLAYLASVRWDRVLQVHMAGHLVRPDGLRHDTHDRPVCAEVWALYREAWALGGPFPTLLEWDDQVPPLPEVLAEVAKAASVRT